MTKLVLLFLAVIFAVECKHTFLGTNVLRPLLHHTTVKYGAKIFQKRIETFQYTMPHNPTTAGKYIQGILAYDLTNTEASANVTEGGIGTNNVRLRMKSERNKDMKFDIYIYG